MWREHPAERRTEWALPPAIAPRLARELVELIARPVLPRRRHELATDLSEAIVQHVQDVVSGSVWLRTDVRHASLRVAVADTALTVRAGLPAQGTVGLPPRVRALATDSGIDRLDEHRRRWWFQLDA